MFDKTIYIRDPKTTLAVNASHFTLRSQGRQIGRIPPTMIGQVIVEQGVEITRKALDRLGTMGAPVTFLGKGGRVQARLVAPWKPHPAGRLGQAQAWFDESVRFALAQRWIDAKLANCGTVLRRYLSNHRDERLSQIVKELRRYRDAVPGTQSIPSLMGVEGMAARIWFEAIGRMLRTEWLTFSGRNRQPPKDPGNAVLSYSYAVLSHQLLACVEAEGLDPYIGYLHSTESRRPSLVLDLLEPFRPALGDRLMLRLLNLGILREDHFGTPDGPHNGVRISREGREAVLLELGKWVQQCDSDLGSGMPSPGSLLMDEVSRFTKHAATRNLAEFVPFHLDPSEVR
jgi:CRISPR-associated protein Cas1